MRLPIGDVCTVEDYAKVTLTVPFSQGNSAARFVADCARIMLAAQRRRNTAGCSATPDGCSIRAGIVSGQAQAGDANSRRIAPISQWNGGPLGRSLCMNRMNSVPSGRSQRCSRRA